MNMPTVKSPGGSRILGVGAYRPVRVVDNNEICQHIDSSDEWIRRRSGIVTRRFAGPDETVITMAAEAARKALAHGGIDPKDIGAVLLASMSFLEQTPHAAPRIAQLLGVSAAALDVSAACAGFSYALALASSLVRSGQVSHVVVIGSERMSDVVDPTDRGTAFLFGDGAGAVVVGAAETPGIGPVVWGSTGEGHQLITYEHSWTTAGQQALRPRMRMAGTEVFRWAIDVVPDLCRQALDAAGLSADDLAAYIPHQASGRIVERTAAALGLGPHTVIARDVVRSGNTSAASIPLAMDDLLSQGAISTGDHALLVGFGAGLAYAAQVVTVP